MKEKTLLKTALITSLIGLIALYIISSNLEINETSIQKITLENKDDFIKLNGFVTKVVNAEKVSILEITQPQKITVVLFKNKNKNISISEGSEVEIFGRVDEYEGNMEIIAERIRVVG